MLSHLMNIWKLWSKKLGQKAIEQKKKERAKKKARRSIESLNLTMETTQPMAKK